MYALYELVGFVIAVVFDFVEKHMKALFYLALLGAAGLLIYERGIHMEPFLAAILAALAFGTLGGWLLLVVAVIIVTALVENDHEIWAFLSLAGTAALLYHLHLADFGVFVIHHPYQLAGWVLGYFAAGAGYGVIKWTSVVTGYVERYNEAKADWLRTRVTVKPNAITTPEEALAFKNTLKSDLKSAPQVRSHKSEILVWMTYWPFSGLWWLFSDPVRRIFKFIYTHMSGVLQRISDSLYKGASADLALAEEAEKAEKENRESEKARRDAENAAQETNRWRR